MNKLLPIKEALHEMPDPNKAHQKQYSAPLSWHPRPRFATVEGKTSKQFHQADGNVIHMLNLFVHDFKLTLQQVVKNGKEVSCTKRYFVSSLDASLVSAERFLTLVDGPWQVESRLHLMKERWWGGEKGKSIPRRAKMAAHQPLQCLKRMGY